MAHGELPPRSGRREPRPERQAAFHVGISAESRAAAFLIAKGFRILARRWRSPLGEIDIVARRRRLLVFVEVKAGQLSTTRRSWGMYGNAGELPPQLRSG
jgi:putative endonuclease